jgi:3',5'-cyclic AMP phosphodiesterase CpdA
MKIVAHVSDLHFGTEEPRVVEGLLADLHGVALLAVSGDLTQRATAAQFEACRAFLDRVPAPSLVVPGNHDVPLYDVFHRFTDPLGRYRRHFADDVEPTYRDDELAFVGVATAHGLTRKGGRITREQAERVRARLADAGPRWRAVVAHHPFVLPRGDDEDEAVRGGTDALAIFREARVEVLLTGHLHVARLPDEAGFQSEDRTLIALHAGSSLSTRLRGEANGYNRLTFDGDVLTIAHRLWDGARFVDHVTRTYRRNLVTPASGPGGSAPARTDTPHTR